MDPVSTRGRKRQSTLDMNDFRNWKKAKLVEEIETLGGVVHPSWNLTTLRQTYEMNVAKRQNTYVSNISTNLSVNSTVAGPPPAIFYNRGAI